MLGFVDGEATVEDIVMAAGLKAERAYKTLAVAKFLGLIEVRPPAQRRAQASPELDVQRLESKFEQVQDRRLLQRILGLARNAGSDEVQRAYERLAEEFDPLRFSGHPDASLQQRAQVVHRLLEGARQGPGRRPAAGQNMPAICWIRTARGPAIAHEAFRAGSH